MHHAFIHAVYVVYIHCSVGMYDVLDVYITHSITGCVQCVTLCDVDTYDVTYYVTHSTVCIYLSVHAQMNR